MKNKKQEQHHRYDHYLHRLENERRNFTELVQSFHRNVEAEHGVWDQHKTDVARSRGARMNANSVEH